jgi:hypothetical protein
MTDALQPTMVLNEARFAGAAEFFLPIRKHGRKQRIRGKCMQHVRDQKLQMLLLVVEA